MEDSDPEPEPTPEKDHMDSAFCHDHEASHRQLCAFKFAVSKLSLIELLVSEAKPDEQGSKLSVASAGSSGSGTVGVMKDRICADISVCTHKC